MLEYSKYFNLLVAINNCGFITKSIAQKNFNANYKVINKLISDDLLLPLGNHMIYGKISSIYTITKKCKQKLNALNLNTYKSDLNQLEHDYLLLETYANLPFEVQFTWKNESVLKLETPGETTTDAVFTFHNKIIAIEVITSSYKSDIIKLKEDYAKKYCNDIILLNTNNVFKSNN